MRRSSVASPLAASLLGTLLAGSIASAAEPLVIHEWGTFTSLQDEQGRTIGGLNVDEEFLPPFVHNLDPVRIGYLSEVPATRIFKGMSACNPTVTMRLETPVVYVHLPPGQESATFDLSATFHGGFLSQFYPMAEPSVDRRPLRWQDVTTTCQVDGKETSSTERQLQVLAPGENGATTWQRWQAPVLTPATTSTLTWRRIRVGDTTAGPETDSPIWLAPRQVDAANLTVGHEQERYLFYRGLANLDAPLVAKRSADGRSLRVTPRGGALDPSTVPRLWLADLRGDGTAAFCTVAAAIRHPQSTDEPAFSDIPAAFTPDDYSSARLATLRQELQAALVADGLFADEALALLNTWEASYFKAPGQRLFFLVPRAWTDRVLPLTTSIPAVISRSMVGRIEVVSPTQRQALTTIADGPVSTGEWFDRLIEVSEEKSGEERTAAIDLMFRLRQGQNGLFAKFEVTLPPDYQAYLSLGRFRDALLWDAQRVAPDVELAKFLRTYVANEKTFIQDWQKAALAAKPTVARKTR